VKGFQNVIQFQDFLGGSESTGVWLFTDLIALAEGRDSTFYLWSGNHLVPEPNLCTPRFENRSVVLRPFHVSLAPLPEDGGEPA
jgi:hypothetical protein